MKNVIASWLFESDGVVVALYVMNSGRSAVRVSNVDPDETIGITVYPTADRAKVGYEQMLSKMIAGGGC